MDTKELRLTFSDITPEHLKITTSLIPDAKNFEIFFQSNDIPLTCNPESLLSVGILPAMKTGSTLVAEGSISKKLSGSLDLIENYFCRLNTSLQRVKIITGTPDVKKPPQENRVGAFFSGGVDSFYTFLKNQEEITDLIFIRGFDITSDSSSRLQKASEVIHTIGAQWSKTVIEVHTNLNAFLNLYVPVLHSYGIFLITVGHLVAPSFRRIYIPASLSYQYVDFGLLASHPAMDPLWSTEALEFVHDGCEATRIDKAALIAKSDLALKSLRVCFDSPTGALNCGVCEKCLRTMINLHIAGALERCTTFAQPLDYKRVARILVVSNAVRAYIDENLRALENRPADHEIYNALRKALKRAWWLKLRVYIILRWLKHTLQKIIKLFR